jgi:hypothetical protein
LTYRPWARISNHGRGCTQASLLYIKRVMKTEYLLTGWRNNCRL